MTPHLQKIISIKPVARQKPHKSLNLGRELQSPDEVSTRKGDEGEKVTNEIRTFIRKKLSHPSRRLTVNPAVRVD